MVIVADFTLPLSAKGETMPTAKELLITYTELIREPEKAVLLFASDGAIEIPYLIEVGGPGRFQGHPAILAFLKQINSLFPEVAFSNTQFFMESPDQVVAEYEVHSAAPATGRRYDQLFFGRLVAANGKITLLREALNNIVAARTILPNGLGDVTPQLSASIE
jgi:ketosteroid isomerase-like protein